jgi:lysophospholipase L1-like esterase
MTSLFPLLLTPDPVPPPPYRPPALVAVFGDSWSVGLPAVGMGPGNWTRILSARLQASMAVQAVGGSGYARYWQGSMLPFQPAVTPVPGADAVIVFGGLNDEHCPDPAQVRAGAAATFAGIRAWAPDVPVIAAGPQWYTPVVPALMAAHRDGIARAATDYGVTFVDALAGRWLIDFPWLFHPGDIHPNDAGHRVLADLIEPHLTAALTAWKMRA